MSNITRSRILLAFFLLACAVSTGAQTLNMVSTGTDGPLNLTTPGTIYFDPSQFNPQLHPNGNTVYNWTTINIAAGVDVILSSQYLSGPVYWLASGSVNIAGTIDLSGQSGHPVTSSATQRIPSFAGAGGFGGGVGGNGTAGMPATPGNGPMPGSAGNPGNGTGGSFTANQYLMPLFGGSGGGGGTGPCIGGQYGGGGGAGGGAILIASAVSITLGGVMINASGGLGPTCSGSGTGGAGSGGAVRLVAPQISGSSAIFVQDGNGGQVPPTAGLIRIESLNLTQSNVSDVVEFFGPGLVSVPFAVTPPSTPSGEIFVTSIDGMPVKANPFTFPDASIDTTAPVLINITAHNIPVGTVPTLYITSESAPDMTVAGSGLIGTLDTSTSTASFAFPTGGSRGFVKAVWAPANQPSAKPAARKPSH